MFEVSCKLAVDKDYIKESPFERIKITGKIFSKTQKKKSESLKHFLQRKNRELRKKLSKSIQKNYVVSVITCN